MNLIAQNKEMTQIMKEMRDLLKSMEKMLREIRKAFLDKLETN